jgi:predicted small metal-binding protein
MEDPRSSADGPGLMEVVCPMCNGLVEADDEETLVELAMEHCRDVHGYAIPREHVLAAARKA